jgi:Tol biopolymer transport system component
MRKWNIIWIAVILVVLIAGLQTAWAQSACSWSINTLRGDALYPPGWEKFGGTLGIRRPFVRLYSDGDGMLIKGFEFEVRNSSTVGENNAANPLVDGVLSVIVSYLPAQSDERVFQFIPYTDVFEKGAEDYFQVELSSAINTGYVHLIADIPTGELPASQYCLPAGIRDLALMLVLNGTFETKTPVGLALGGYLFDPMRRNHTRLAYCSQPGGMGNPSAIHSVLANGQEILSHTGELSGDPWYFSPAWSPNGQQMAIEKKVCIEYSSDDTFCSSHHDIVVTDLMSESAFPQNVASTFHLVDDITCLYDGDPYDLWLQTPGFSPEGDRFAAIINAGIQSDLGIFSIETGDWEYVGGCEMWVHHPVIGGSAPAWNPQSDTIAFYMSTADGTQGTGYDGPGESAGGVIKVIGVDGSNNTQITSRGYFDTTPAWSPDGQWIAFSSNRDDRESVDIWIMDRNGNHIQKIYSGDAHCLGPSFSPDGLAITFGQGGDVYTIDIWRGNVTNVTQDQPTALYPDWSPVLPIPSADIRADTAIIEAGQNVTLSWTSAQGKNASIDNDIGNVALSGSHVVSPAQTTTYTLSVSGLGGTVTDSVRVVVR